MRDINEMTRRRFELARHLRDTRDWDFLMMVEMGTDRLHHGFWRFYDHDAPRLRAGHALGAGVPRLLPDGGRRDRPADRGPGRRHGGAGRLRPRRAVDVRRHPGERVADARGLPDAGRAARRRRSRSARRPIDWPNTRVWADGGYYSRIFLNVRGREPEGIVDPDEVRGAARRADRQAGGAGRRAGQPDRHARLPPGGPLPRGQRGRARPDLLLRQPDLALDRLAGRRPHPGARERHRARRREPREDGRLRDGRPGHARARARVGDAVRHRAHRADRDGLSGAGRHAGQGAQLILHRARRRRPASGRAHRGAALRRAVVRPVARVLLRPVGAGEQVGVAGLDAEQRRRASDRLDPVALRDASARKPRACWDSWESSATA